MTEKLQLSYPGHEEEPNEEKPSVQFPSANIPNDVMDTIDRPGNAYTKSKYARAGKYAGTFENQRGMSIQKAGAYAEAGVGEARAEYRAFEAEAKGPNASAGAEIGETGLGAMARAELASVSTKAGAVGVKLGLGVDTGLSAGVGGVEAKVLGTGFSIGEKNSVSLLGSEVSCVVM